MLPPVVVKAVRPPSPFQIDAAVRLSLSASDVKPGVAGLFSVTWRRRGLLIFSAGGIEQQIEYYSNSAAAVIQRVPVILGLGYELAIPSGAIRFAGGALLDVMLFSTDEAAGKTSTVWLSGGVHGSITYHYRPAHLVDVFAGLDFEQDFNSHKYLTHDGSLAVAAPTTWFSPKVGLSLNFP